MTKVIGVNDLAKELEHLKQLLASLENKLAEKQDEPQPLRGWDFDWVDAKPKPWIEAMRVLWELRQCAGVEASTNDCLQYTISLYSGKIEYLRWSDLSPKVVRLFPSFSTVEHVEAAVEKVGADRIMAMFNYMNGV